MARLGFRTIDEMVGRSDRLEMRPALDHWKARSLDFSRILAPARRARRPTGAAHDRPGARRRGVARRDDAARAVRAGARARACRSAPTLPIRNVNRVVGTMLGSEVTRRWGRDGLPDDTIDLALPRARPGRASGRSSRAGITLRLEGDANDYLGKGLSGGRIVVLPAGRGARFARRRERHRRQRRALRRHRRRGVHPGHRRRAVRGPQLRRHGGRGGRRRPRLRVHDRRPGGRPGPDRAQLRGGHVRRHRLGLRRGRRRSPRRCNTEMVGLEPLADAGRRRPRSRDAARAPRRRSPGSDAGRGAPRATGTTARGALRAGSSRTTTGASSRPQARMRGAGPRRRGGRDGRVRGERPGPRAGVGGLLTMGKPTGFIEFERGAGARAPAAGADPATGARRTRTYDEATLARAGRRAAWTAASPSATPASLISGMALGLPDQQPHPRVERPRLPRPVARGVDPPPPDQQLPGVHRPGLPGAVRGLVHGGHQRRPGDDQDHRAGDRRPRLGGGLDRARAAAHADRAAAWRSSGSGPGGPRRGATSSTGPGHLVTVFERAGPHRRAARCTASRT